MLHYTQTPLAFLELLAIATDLRAYPGIVAYNWIGPCTLWDKVPVSLFVYLAMLFNRCFFTITKLI